jgi:hypothetical protein
MKSLDFRADPNHCYIPASPDVPGGGEFAGNWVRVPCPEPATSTASSPAGGSSAVPPTPTPASIFTGFYVGVNGNASFALPASQSLTFNTDGHSDSESGKTRSATGGGVNLIVGYDFNTFNVGPVVVQPVTVMNFTYTNVDVRTPYGMTTLHFDQNLYNLGVDGRLRFPNCSPFTPFVEGGFGLGISEGSFRLYGPGINSFLGHATALAPVAQLGTGVDFKLGGGWSLYLEGTAQIPLNDYDYRMTHVSSLGGGDASITTTTPIDLGIGFGAKYNFY